MSYDPNPVRYPDLQDLTYQFQPIESTNREGFAWYEALVRWRLPDGTIRGPLDVLPYWLGPTRRETFTRFTVNRAAAAMLDRPAARISINLSPAQVMQPAVSDALANLQPDLQERLVVELTEQQITNIDAYWHGLDAIRERIGLIVLDDVRFDDLDLRTRFGAPIDGVKLDRSLLPALLGGTYHQRALDIVESARERFDIVVAEGVEDATVCDRLRDLGITHVQGFGIARPSGTIPDVRSSIDEPRPAPSDRRERPAQPARFGPRTSE